MSTRIQPKSQLDSMSLPSSTSASSTGAAAVKICWPLRPMLAAGAAEVARAEYLRCATLADFIAG